MHRKKPRAVGNGNYPIRFLGRHASKECQEFLELKIRIETATKVWELFFPDGTFHSFRASKYVDQHISVWKHWLADLGAMR